MPHQKFRTRREWNDAAIYNREITRAEIKLDIWRLQTIAYLSFHFRSTESANATIKSRECIMDRQSKFCAYNTRTWVDECEVDRIQTRLMDVNEDLPHGRKSTLVFRAYNFFPTRNISPVLLKITQFNYRAYLLYTI